MGMRRIFWILFLLNLFNYMDRQVLYAVFPLLQLDLHLADWQLGTLASVFMVVYMCYAPVMGVLADRFSRTRLIGISALIWSVATLLSGAAKNFSHLLFARGLTGVGEGGFTTIAQPFLAEHAPKEKHALLLALFGLALPLGSALGYGLGGVIGQTWGWRMAFIGLGVPGILLGLCACFLPDKGRALPEKPRPSLAEYTQLLHHKPFLFVCLIQTAVTFLMGGCSAWVPTYFVRYLHVNAAQAGVWFGILVIMCGALGTLVGGKWAEKRLAHSARAYYEVMFISLAGCIVPLWLGLQSAHVATALAWFGITIFFLFLPTGAIAAALVATSPVSVRATAFALNLLIIHLLGDALSPVLIGILSGVWSLKVAIALCSLVVFPGLVLCHYIGRQK